MEYKSKDAGFRRFDAYSSGSSPKIYIQLGALRIAPEGSIA